MLISQMTQRHIQTLLAGSIIDSLVEQAWFASEMRMLETPVPKYSTTAVSFVIQALVQDGWQVTTTPLDDGDYWGRAVRMTSGLSTSYYDKSPALVVCRLALHIWYDRNKDYSKG